MRRTTVELTADLKACVSMTRFGVHQQKNARKKKSLRRRQPCSDAGKDRSIFAPWFALNTSTLFLWRRRSTTRFGRGGGWGVRFTGRFVACSYHKSCTRDLPCHASSETGYVLETEGDVVVYRNIFECGETTVAGVPRSIVGNIPGHHLGHTCSVDRCVVLARTGK